MARSLDDAPVITVRNRTELRDWLAANHADAGSVWLATFRRHHADYLSYEPMVEELLCWGWIDSVSRALDDDRTRVLISPRKVTSAWSALNKAHVERARGSGMMMPSGEAKIAAAKANGMWDFLDDVERLEMPPDLGTALLVAGAREAWEAYPRSIRRAALEWLKNARTADTRAERIREIAASAGEGLRPRPFRR
jgi:uncharacterized protein YdeI (YjbR/CyaY-like superfamily)